MANPVHSCGVRASKQGFLGGRRGHDSVQNTMIFFKNIYLFGCAGSWLQHVGASSQTRDGPGPLHQER